MQHRHPAADIDLEAQQDAYTSTVVILTIVWFAAAGGGALLLTWIFP